MIAPFTLELYFDKHEFSAPWLLSSSDCEPVSLQTLLNSMRPELRTRWDAQTLSYTPTRGDPQLREEIASLYTGVSPEQILIAAPEECIYLSMRALLRPDDHVICTAPGYQSLYEVARAIGCEVSFWEPESSTLPWRFSPEALEGLARPNTAMLVMNFPHNPTGAVLSPDAFDAVIAWAQERDIRVFSDEMYRLLERSPEARPRSAVEADPRALTLSGLSKSFGLPGLRIGWIATGDEEALAQLRQYKDYTTICTPGPTQLLGIAGLQMRAQLLKQNLARLRRNEALFGDFVQRRAARLRWEPPAAGPITFVELLQERASVFCDRAVKEAGVMLLPSTVYGWKDSHFRVGLGRESLPEALKRLDAHLG